MNAVAETKRRWARAAGVAVATAVMTTAAAGASPAQAKLSVSLAEGELRLEAGDERNRPHVTFEGGGNDSSFYLVVDSSGTALLPGGAGCSGDSDGVTCDTAAVTRVVLSLGAGDDSHYNLEFQHKPVTWFGGDGHDELGGTSGNDVMHGEGGPDVLNDHSNGSRADSDVLDGGAGPDDLFSEHGDDRLIGGGGNDEFFVSRGRDRVDGGAGRDTIWLSQGSHSVSAGSGNDWIRVGRGSAVVDCGPGFDTVATPFGGKPKLRGCERRTRRRQP